MGSVLNISQVVTVACFLPGRAKDLPAPPHRLSGYVIVMYGSHTSFVNYSVYCFGSNTFIWNKYVWGLTLMHENINWYNVCSTDL